MLDREIIDKFLNKFYNDGMDVHQFSDGYVVFIWEEQVLFELGLKERRLYYNLRLLNDSLSHGLGISPFVSRFIIRDWFNIKFDSDIQNMSAVVFTTYETKSSKYIGNLLHERTNEDVKQILKSDGQNTNNS